MRLRHPLLRCGLALAISLGWVTASANAAEPANSALAPNVHPRYFPQASRSLRSSVTSGNIAAVSSASFLPGISPGGLVTIFGYNLSDVSGIVVAQTSPLPYVLAGVSVTVNGIDAPLFSVAFNGTEDQVTIQVPYDTPTGPDAATIQVYDYGESVGTTQADSYDEDPGIFLYQGNYAVALLYPDYSLIGPNNPAYPGDIVILYTTGLGPLSLPMEDGYAAPSSPLAQTVDPFQVMLAGQPCTVYFSGLAPGFIGLYQLNLRVPENAPRGNLDMQITSPYASSNVATLPVF